MHLLNDTKSRVGKALCHYMRMRLKFRGTVFSDSRSAAQPLALKAAKLTRPQQTSSKLL
ncbi:MAG: hypothetical protein ACJA2Q_002781 [Pseudohongiellaceae bacterium]|jgi:hypothetical protein